jgi:hypothetical protein
MVLNAHAVYQEYVMFNAGDPENLANRIRGAVKQVFLCHFPYFSFISNK